MPGCTECLHFSDDSERGEYGHLYYEAYSCDDNPGYGNLKSFPFKSAPGRCFIPSYWCSEFASDAESWSPEADASTVRYRVKYFGESQEEAIANIIKYRVEEKGESAEELTAKILAGLDKPIPEALACRA